MQSHTPRNNLLSVIPTPDERRSGTGGKGGVGYGVEEETQEKGREKGGMLI